MRISVIRKALKKDFANLLNDNCESYEYDQQLLKDVKFFIDHMKFPNLMVIIKELESKAERFESEKEELTRMYDNGKFF